MMNSVIYGNPTHQLVSSLSLSIMQENEIITMITHGSSQQRLITIERLHAAIRDDRGHLPFAECYTLFMALSTALEDENVDTRIPCLKLMLDIIPSLGTDGGIWIAMVLPAMMACFGDARKSVQLSVAQVLQSSLKHLNFQNVMQMIISKGLEADEFKIKKAVLSFLPMLLNDELRERNFIDLIHSLFSGLSEQRLQSDILATLRELSDLVGKDKFAGYIDAMSKKSRQTYFLLIEEERNNGNANNSSSRKSDNNIPNGHRAAGSHFGKENLTLSELFDVKSVEGGLGSSMRFGIVPIRIGDDLMDDDNHERQTKAIGELKIVLDNCKNIDLLIPHLHEFIDFLVELLDNSNTKVNKVTLEIFEILVDRCELSLKPHIRHLLLGLTKHVGDNIPFFREGIMKMVTRLMQISSPKHCLSVVCENLNHRNSRVRQESVNVIIVALLTFPSSDFDLAFICKKVAFALIDPKRQVRQATLECFAVLGQSMGPFHRDALIDAVSVVEERLDGVGAVAAVQARLTNLQLPKKGASGLVEYVARSPSGADNTADFDWILAASSGHGSSAKSVGSDSLCLDSVDNSARSYLPSVHLNSPSQHSITRSRPSMRKSLAKMTWDTDSNQVEQHDKRSLKRITSSGDVTKIPFLKNNLNFPVSPADKLPPNPLLVRPGSVKRISSAATVPPIHSPMDERDSYLRYGDMSKSTLWCSSKDGEDSSRTESDSARKAGSASKRRVEKMFEKLEKKDQSSARSRGSPDKGNFNVNGHIEERRKVESPSEGKMSYSSKNSNSTLRTNFDVAVFGKGYTEDSPLTNEPHRSVPIQNGRDRQKPRAGLSTIGGGGASFFPEDDSISSGLIGKGMFDRVQSVSSHIISNNILSPDDRPIRPASDKNLMTGVYGIGVYNTPDDNYRDDQKEMQLDRVISYEQKKQQLDEEIKKEKQRRLDSANSLNHDGFEVDSGFVMQKPPLRSDKESQKRKPKKSSTLKQPLPSVAKLEQEAEDPKDLKPSSDPERLLSHVLKQLSHEDWEEKCKELNNIRRLVIHHSKVFDAQLHAVVVLVVLEVKNLRSSVSILAMKCLADMFTYLKFEMDSVLDNTVSVLLIRVGDVNNFIREEADKTLKAMVENVSPQKVLSSLISFGSKNRNAAIRSVTSQLVVTIVETLSPDRVLNDGKDIADKILPVAAVFINDGSPEARFNGRKIFYMLMFHEDFNRALRKHLSRDTLSSIQDKLDSLKSKGLGEPLSETSSARSRRSTIERKGSSRSNSAARPSSDTSSTSTRVKRFDESSLNEVADLVKKMSLNDFRERCTAIDQLRDLTNANPALVGSNITLVFDKFVPCLRDANSKVTLLALQALWELTPMLHTYMGSVISLTVQAIVANLASNNKETREAASRVLDTFIELIDPICLLPLFTNQTQNCIASCKPDMVQRVAYLVPQLYPSKPKSIVLHVLPLVWYLLGGGGGSSSAVRTATSDLVKTLYSEMGETLIQSAPNSNVTPHMRQLLRDIVNSSS